MTCRAAVGAARGERARPLGARPSGIDAVGRVPAAASESLALSDSRRRHRARGLLGRVGVLLDRGGVDVLRFAGGRDLGTRRERLLAAARDRRAQRRAPSRPSMRALHLVGPGRLEWRAVPTPPAPGPAGATVRPVAVATCDLDGAMALGATPFPAPLEFGHECVAEVLAVGDEVTSFRPGQRVVVPFQISCGSCSPCRAGLTSNCAAVPPLSMYGFGVAGGHWGGMVADQVAVPFAEAMLVPLPGGIDPAAAASVADNVCDAYRHVAPHLPRILQREPEADVLVVGALKKVPFSGSMGLYAGQIALALGARQVRLVDARPEVRDTAARLGLSPFEPSDLRRVRPAPLVVAASGDARGLRWAFDRTAPDGVCSSVGGLFASARVPVAGTFVRNFTYHVGRTNTRSVIPEVLALISSGRLRPEHVITTRGPMDRAVEVLDHHIHSDDVKAVLTA